MFVLPLCALVQQTSAVSLPTGWWEPPANDNARRLRIRAPARVIVRFGFGGVL
jgi:hypothetical protein